MSVTEIYNLDITGEAPENVIVNEAHAIGSSKVFIAKTGAFFTKSLVVTQDGNELHRGLDWKPIVFNSKASTQVGAEIHTGIVTSNMLSTEPVLLSYQTVGGEYAGYQESILELIEVLGLETSLVQYGDLVGVPDVFAPAPHKTLAEDLIGMSRVVEMLARLEDALSTKQLDMISDLTNRIKSKVDLGGRHSVKPQGGALTLPSGSDTMDVTLPRSEPQNAKVMLELLFESDNKPYKAMVGYHEVSGDVTNVQGFYVGPGTLETPIDIGIRAGNGLSTLLRLTSNEGGAMNINNLYVASMVTSDTELNSLYGKVAMLDTPSSLPFQTQQLIPSSGDVTTTVIDNISNNYTNLENRVVNAENKIIQLNQAIDNPQQY